MNLRTTFIAIFSAVTLYFLWISFKYDVLSAFTPIAIIGGITIGSLFWLSANEKSWLKIVGPIVAIIILIAGSVVFYTQLDAESMENEIHAILLLVATLLGGFLSDIIREKDKATE
jgi:hypothetical protein